MVILNKIQRKFETLLMLKDVQYDMFKAHIIVWYYYQTEIITLSAMLGILD